MPFVLLVLLILVLAFLALFAFYVVTCWRNRQDAFPSAQAYAAGTTLNGVTCIDKPGIGLVFLPEDMSDAVGLVYLPGALVEHIAYAPLCSGIARDSKSVVVLPKVHLRMSPFGGSKRIEAAMAAYPNIKSWAVGGHSMGAVTATSFTAANPGKVKGIVYHGAYPTADVSAQTSLRALLVRAELDGLIQKDLCDKNTKTMLPPGNLTNIELLGGNHAGFGHYGPQTFPRKDGERTISLEEQQAKAVDATARWLTSLHVADYVPPQV